ncbi:hypothetical protein SCHPADRAFT_911069 [Schizopora paradoxa]|uniref:F-box domain-containing protein n=1 Tax=Schizopora paradoxa TaxID=27342 RepID=A0A0H2RKU2_9AGAM|nr:hypothetical protein SCHPADRAFT_911069 [Schizopora paradoxa]
MATRKYGGRRGARKKRRVSNEVSGEIESGWRSGVEHEQSPTVAQLLPLDVLREVFLHAIPSGYHASVKAATLGQWRSFFSNIFPVNLTLVCRSWRAAAIDTPGIWSKWYINVHSPSQKALLIMKRFLACVIGRSDAVNLTLHLWFTGTFDGVRACDAVSPIMKYQERWEDVDIDLGKGLEDNPVCRIYSSRLHSLRRLRLIGPQWTCYRTETRTAPSSRLDVPPIHILHLDNLQSATLHSISNFQQLSELSICLHEDFRNHGSLKLPALRRLGIRKAFYYKGDRFHSILSNMECNSLQELSIENTNTLSLQGYIDFVVRNGLANTLLSLRLIFAVFHLHGHHPEDAENDIISLLRLLTSLRRLAIFKGMNGGSLSAMTSVTAGRFQLCPLLEELVLDYVKADEHLFADLVNARWNEPGRCIKSMTFLRCAYRKVGKRDVYFSHISGTEACVQNGLKLNVSVNMTEDMKDYGLGYATIDCCQT